jgi:DNA-binding IclR family transcriptional regulator
MKGVSKVQQPGANVLHSPSSKKTRKTAREKQKTPPTSRAVVKTLQALEILRSMEDSVPLGKIASSLGLAKASAYRLLQSLETSGYLVVDGGGRYLMPQNVRPVLPSRFLSRLVDASLPRMRQLSREHRETITLAALFRNHAEVVAVVESPEVIRMGNTVGRILPPNSSSLGKAMLAFLPEERRESLIQAFGLYRFTEHTITDAQTLRQELEEVAGRGYASDLEENVLDGCCVGVPIRNAVGQAVAALSASMPKMRYSEERAAGIVAALASAAAAIAASLQSGQD